MNKLKIEQTISSLEVAEMVGKDHNKLLRDVREYISQLDASNLGHTEFFTESEYVDKANRKKPCYNVTKKGCEFIAHKLTGVKGTEFTAKYINRFHDMEDIIREGIPQKSKSAIDQLRLTQQAILEVDDKISAVDEDLQTFKQDMPILGIEESKITAAVRRKGVKCLGGKDSEAYQDRSLRGKVYADIYGQLKREFGVDTYKAIKRSMCDRAVEVIEGYQLPLVLEETILDSNAQVRM